jgi:Uncharacterized conserved protein
MQRKLVITKDGSHSVEIPEWQVTYHSLHGAIQESMHVFIEAGLKFWWNRNRKTCRVFEMGFGTGLNALLSWRTGLKIDYEAVEAFPLEKAITDALNYSGPELERLHGCAWNTAVQLGDGFFLKKVQASLPDYTPGTVDVIYYDAFAPDVQPELWTEALFAKMHDSMAPGGILVTYCSKGAVRRAMQAVGFTVEKLPGPPGKREIIRAYANE